MAILRSPTKRWFPKDSRSGYWQTCREDCDQTHGGRFLLLLMSREQALKGDGAGYVGFTKIADEYSSTDAGNLANLYAGLCYANLGKWAEAQKSLEAFSSEDDQMISPAAESALGDAYAHLNQLDKAVDAFKKAASMADSKAEDGTNNSLSPTFIIKAGEILESQGKKDEALKLYQDAKKKYVNAMLVQGGEIDKYIERASN